MAMIYDAAAAKVVQAAINSSGQAAWMIPGGFVLGGASGNQPIAYDPDVVRPYVLRAAEPLSRGQVNMGGVYAPITHLQAPYFIGLYTNALELVGEKSQVVVPASNPGWPTHEAVAVPSAVKAGSSSSSSGKTAGVSLAVVAGVGLAIWALWGR